MKTLFDISINNLDGLPFDWETVKGKKILLVNVASACGYTRQYAPMQELSVNLSDKITVIGVPCNDFGGQEPGSEKEIQTFCETNFGVTFPLLEKVGITENTHPLYDWLTNRTQNGTLDSKVEWNFHKFLIDEEGGIIASFPSAVSPLDEAILSKI